MKYRLQRPCSECPFRTTSPSGWLGPWSPEELVIAVRNIPFPCHKTIGQGDDVQMAHEKERLEACAGAALFLNNSCTLSRDIGMAGYQRGLRNEAPPPNDEVFASTDAFLEHHGEEGFERWIAGGIEHVKSRKAVRCEGEEDVGPSKPGIGPMGGKNREAGQP